MKKYDTFEEFIKNVIFHQEDVVLPDSKTISKFPYITNKGFDYITLHLKLREIYEQQYKTNG